MKKFILSTLLTLSYLIAVGATPRAPAPLQVNAETAQYACILQDDAYFYATQDETRGLFLLPKTYFVKVLSVDGAFSQIEYLTDSNGAKKVQGFAKTDQLTPVDFIPQTPYLLHTFSVRYIVEGGNPVDSSFLTSITLQCVYYGDYTVGTSTYCYVLRDGVFGYIPKPTDLAYAENPEYANHLASRPPTSTDTPPTTDEEAMNPVQIAILVAMCLLVPTLAALILKPPKRLPYEQEES